MLKQQALSHFINALILLTISTVSVLIVRNRKVSNSSNVKTNNVSKSTEKNLLDIVSSPEENFNRKDNVGDLIFDKSLIIEIFWVFLGLSTSLFLIDYIRHW